MTEVFAADIVVAGCQVLPPSVETSTPAGDHAGACVGRGPADGHGAPSEKVAPGTAR